MKNFAYIRVSTTEQNTSLEAQQSKILDYCKFKGLDKPEFLIDEDVSGGKPIYARPAGSKLKDLKPDNIIAIKLDRLFRNTVDALITIDLWDKKKIALHIIDMNGASIDTGTAIGKVFITMIAGFAEFERNLISERTSVALQYKKSKLEAYGNTPFGFYRQNGSIIPDTEEMKVIELIFDLHRNKVSFSEIARQLNFKRIKSKKGGSWYPAGIRYVLNNNLYQL